MPSAPRAQRVERAGHRDHRPSGEQADEHLELPLEAVEAGAAEGGECEQRQRARRVLDLEVAVRQLAVGDRDPVAIVLDRVSDQLVVVEADVEERKRDEEEPEGRVQDPGSQDAGLVRAASGTGSRSLAVTGSAAGASTAKAANGKNHGT